jgi:flagellar basal-body rod protein FlgG
MSTSGFKRSCAVFEDLLYQNTRQPGAQTLQQSKLPPGLQVGTGVRTVATYRNFTHGNLQQTINDKDLAIQGQGNGYFQVALPYGTTGYTRAGSFQNDSHGQMVTASGFIIHPAITILANASAITVVRDGTVLVTKPGAAAPVQVVQLQLATFINSAGLESKGQKLYVETAASGNPGINTPGTNGAGMLTQGTWKPRMLTPPGIGEHDSDPARVSNQQHGHHDMGSDAEKLTH